MSSVLRMVLAGLLCAGSAAAVPPAGAAMVGLDIEPSPTIRLSSGQSASLPLGGFIESVACWPAGEVAGAGYSGDLEVAWNGQPPTIAVTLTMRGSASPCPGGGYATMVEWNPPRQGTWAVRQCRTPPGGARQCLADATLVVGGPSTKAQILTQPSVSDLVPAPTAVSAEFVKEGVARLTWTPAEPTTRWSPAPVWRATSSPGGLICETAGDDVASTCDIRGLKRGVRYSFTVATQWGGLTSPPSAATVPTSWGLVPPTPERLRVVTTTSSARVSWKAPQSAIDGPTRYSVVTTRPGGATCRTGGTSCQVTGLRPATQYTLTVTAFGSRGAKATSVTQTFVTRSLPQAAPSTPATPTEKPTSGLS